MNALRRLTLSLDSLTRGFAVLLSGSVARLALGFVAGVLTARALGPAAFGVYATLGAAANIVGAIADFGLSEAGVRRVAAVWNDDPTTVRERAWAFFRLRVSVAAGVVGVALLLVLYNDERLSEWLLNAANNHDVDETLVLGSQFSVLGSQFSVLGALALLGVLATALSGAVSAMLQATGAYGRLSLVLIVNSALTATLAVALTLLGWLNLVTALAVLGIGTSLVSFALGLRLLPFAERRTTNDGRRTTNDERRTTDDERRMTNDDRRTTDDE
jgi:O-antigen/teichoic acid export membrane protein